MTSLLNDECRGITAYPNTLIGMFFQKTAVKRLCPNVGVTTVSAAGAGQGSEPSQIQSPIEASMTAAPSTQISLLPATPSQISISVTSITSEISTTTAASSILSTTATLSTSTVADFSSAAPSTASSSTSTSTTSIAVVSSVPSSGPDGGDGTTSSSPQNTAVSTSSAKQSNPTAGSQSSHTGGGGNNNGNGGTVLDAASKADRRARAGRCLRRSPSSQQTMATPTHTAEIAQLETELNTQRNNAFFSMTRMGHMNPGIASALASVYRAALTCNTYIRQQAEHEEIDTMWLYFLYSAVGFTTLGVAEMGMSFAAKLIGMAKFFLVGPMVGIPVLWVMRRRSVGEITEFFSGGLQEGAEDRRPSRVERSQRKESTREQ
ncbi:MAG: hypothetical protein Q9170_006513 [Blastenia crenularia]